MNKIAFLLLACLCVSFYSCKMSTVKGEGKIVAENRNVPSFNAISISVPLTANITVKEGAQPSIQFNGYENILKELKTDVESNELRIHITQGWVLDNDKDLTATITVPSLTALSFDGNATTNVAGNITGQSFSLSMSGAGNVNIDNVNVSKLSTDLSGAGNIYIKGGNVQYASYDMSGAGSIKAYDLQTAETEATLSGAGSGEVSATQKLSAHISGVGSIKYKGHPQVISDISGIGSIKEAN